MLKKKSFLERLTGNMKLEDEEGQDLAQQPSSNNSSYIKKISSLQDNNSRVLQANENTKEIKQEVEEEAQLTVDLYQTAGEIVVQAMVAGVQPENLSINITRDTVTLRGKREENQSISEDNYFIQELYWGSFSRSINLPEEIDPEGAEAIEKHGLLIIKLPKVDKNKETKLKVRSI